MAGRKRKSAKVAKGPVVPVDPDRLIRIKRAGMDVFSAFRETVRQCIVAEQRTKLELLGLLSHTVTVGLPDIYRFVVRERVIEALFSKGEFGCKIFFDDNNYGFIDIRRVRIAMKELTKIWDNGIKCKVTRRSRHAYIEILIP